MWAFSPLLVGGAEFQEVVGSAENPAPLPHIGLILAPGGGGPVSADFAESVTADTDITSTYEVGATFDGGVTSAETFGALVDWVSDFSESVTTADDFTSTYIVGGVFDETVSGVEDFVSVYVTASDFLEQVGANDTPDAIVSKDGAFSEVGDGAAEVFDRLADYAPTFSETNTSEEIFDALAAGQGGDSAPLPHIGLLLQEGQSTRAFDEGVTSAEVFAAVSDQVGVFAEVVTADVVFSTSADGEFAETVTAGEVYDATAILGAGFIETVTTAEVFDSTQAGPSEFFETITVDEAFSTTGAVFVSSFAESGNADFVITNTAVLNAVEFFGALSPGESFDGPEAWAWESFTTENVGNVINASFDFSALSWDDGVYWDDPAVSWDASSKITDNLGGEIGEFFDEHATPRWDDGVTHWDDGTLWDIGVELFDAIVALGGPFIESVIASDSFVFSADIVSTLSESVVASDSFVAAQILLGAFGESASAQGDFAGGFLITGVFAEPTIAVESFASATSYGRVFLESVSADVAVDALKVAVSTFNESAVASFYPDSIIGAPSTFLESVTSFESFGALATLGANVTESVSAVGEVFNAQPGSPTGFLELMNGLEDFIAATNRVAPFAEYAGANDEMLASTTTPMQFSETVNAAETFSAAQSVDATFDGAGDARDMFSAALQPPNTQVTSVRFSLMKRLQTTARVSKRGITVK